MPTNLALARVTATGGTASRTFADYLADVNNAKNLGAVGDGTTDDATALAAAAANGGVFLPLGTFKYGTDDNGGQLVGKRFEGPGVVQAGINKQFRYFSFLDAAPAVNPSPGGNGSILTAGNGDWSKTLLPLGFRVQGATTLGDPGTGEYIQRLETAAVVGYGRVGTTAGKNLATDWTDGRTGWAFQQMKIDHHGQGDATAFTTGVDIWSNKAGATHFLAQPAGNVMGGGVTAWVDHVNAVIGEFYVKAGTKDINGTGFALHFERNNATGAQEAMWRAISIISEGTQAIDFAFGARGKINRGFDIGNADLGANQAAIAMSADQRIYGAVTYNNTSSANPLASGYKVFGAYGSAWFRYGSVTSAWDFNNSVNLITGNVLKVNNVQVLGARDTGWTAMTGTPNKAATYDVASVTLPQLAARVAALQAAFTTHGSIGA
jgi:hypothetical protein